MPCAHPLTPKGATKHTIKRIQRACEQKIRINSRLFDDKKQRASEQNLRQSVQSANENHEPASHITYNLSIEVLTLIKPEHKTT